MMRSSILAITFVISRFLHQSQCTCTDPRSPHQFFQKKGSFESTGFPNYYHGNEDCEWDINPQVGKVPLLMIVDVELETKVSNPAKAVNCEGVDNYVQLSHLTGCDKEGPVCVAFMLTSAPDVKCHRVIQRYFSHCSTMLLHNWPLKVKFHTNEAAQMKGFQLNYTFIDCSNYSPPRSTVRPTTSTSTLTSTTAKTTEGNIIQRNATLSNDSKLPETQYIKVTTEGPLVEVTSRTSPTSTAMTSTTTTTTTQDTTTSTSKAIPQGNESSDTGQAPNSTLIAVFVVLCVLFAVLVVIFIFRRRIKEFTQKDKNTTTLTTSPTNNNTIKFASDCIVSMNTERPDKSPPRLTPPASTANTQPTYEEIPAISSTLIGANSNNSNNFRYDPLEEYRRSVTSGEGYDNQAYSHLNR